MPTPSLSHLGHCKAAKGFIFGVPILSFWLSRHPMGLACDGNQEHLVRGGKPLTGLSTSHSPNCQLGTRSGSRCKCSPRTVRKGSLPSHHTTRKRAEPPSGNGNLWFYIKLTPVSKMLRHALPSSLNLSF